MKLLSNIKLSMQTRSQSKRQRIALHFDYDFDYASKCWKENKKYIGNGCYNYVCQGVTKKGKKCNRKAISNEIYCKIHLS